MTPISSSEIVPGSREQIGQSGSRRTFSSVNVVPSASYSSRRPAIVSPEPVISLITSTDWSRPITPGSTPSTPAAPHEGASSAGGGVGYRQREEGAPEGGETHSRPPEPRSDPATTG